MTSSSDAIVRDVVRHRVAAAGRGAQGVRASAPIDAGRGAPIVVRVIDRIPPPPPPPKVDVGALRQTLASGFEGVMAQIDAGFAAIEKECVELALAATEHLVRRKAERGELELVKPLRALLASRRRELAELPATLRLHPDDAKALGSKAAELVPQGARVTLVPDAAQPRGHLTLEVGAARVVRSLDHDLKQLRKQLFSRASP